jgi:hypothetical protein
VFNWMFHVLGEELARLLREKLRKKRRKLAQLLASAGRDRNL